MPKQSSKFKRKAPRAIIKHKGRIYSPEDIAQITGATRKEIYRRMAEFNKGDIAMSDLLRKDTQNEDEVRKDRRVFVEHDGYSYSVDDIVSMTGVSKPGAYWRMAEFRKDNLDAEGLFRNNSREDRGEKEAIKSKESLKREEALNDLFSSTLNDERLYKAYY